MHNKEYLNLLEYWRNTLADAARVEIQVDKTLHVSKAVIDYQIGLVEKEQAIALIKTEEKRLNESRSLDKGDKEWKYLEEVPVLIAPFQISPLPGYAQFLTEKGTFYPFWIRAILNINGVLKREEDTFPYIPRVYLEPQINQDVNFTFSDVGKIDEAFSKPFDLTEHWEDYWSYIRELFTTITGVSLEEYAVENFTVNRRNTIVVNETLSNAADGVIKLYDYLIHNQQTPLLLEKLCEKSLEPLSTLLSIDKFEKASAKHAGQMGFEYSLSISQRKSLYHFNSLPIGNILAVNGPPGTGKTTLLQSIVANEVVKSALHGKEPAVILACSTNNQAVTNIIESFSNVKQKQGILYERWLPRLSGFGLYLPSESKQVNNDVLHFKRKKGGFHKDIENREYLDEAEKLFISRFEKYSGKHGLSLKEITDYLQLNLKENKKKLEDGLRIWQEYKTIRTIIENLKPEEPIQLFNKKRDIDEELLFFVEANIKEIETKVSDYLDKESVWMKVFSFLKFVKEKRAIRLKQIFRDCLLKYENIDFYKIETFHHFFDERLLLIKQIRQLSNAWHIWKSSNHIKGNPPLSDEEFKMAEKERQPFFYDELEIGLKYDQFYKAIHYWEGRWLMAVSQALENDRINKNGQDHSKERWRRFAMLTPCFVSTFYMAPKFFTYSKFIKKVATKSVFENPPLLDFIDLLIVDEAGQVSPEIGAASFALAKQSVVVGDTLQIEPVWNVPEKVDFANLLRYKVAASLNHQTEIGDLLQRGFLSSSGSIMKLAQKASVYHLFPQAERGMLLTEHRRCFNEIIGYCNNLAYNGLLEPLKGFAKNIPLRPMHFVNSSGVSKTIGSSRGNSEEAREIARWIAINSDLLLKHYQHIENVSSKKESRPARVLRLADIIGIITPFTGQKSELKNALNQVDIDIDGITIGTVHALQGAERTVILFSSTYGTNDLGKGFFFDAGVNMLNVAVSRAKEVFVFFGSKENFERKSDEPSVQLYRHIQRLQRS